MTAAPARIIHAEPTGQVKLMEVERRFFDVMTRHFGPRFLNYRKEWERSSNFEYLPEFPLSLDLEVNASCNMQCIMCVMAGKNRRYSLPQSPFMGMNLYKRLMDEAAEHGLPAMTFGFLSEPLIRKNIAEMVSLARKADIMDIRLGTNGSALTARKSKSLIESGLTRLEVSLDAVNPITYSRIRRDGRLDLIEKNIMDFLEERQKAGSDFPVLRLSFLKLPFNKHELVAFKRKWSGLVDMFSIQEPIYFDDAPILQMLELTRNPVPEPFRCAQPWQRLIVRADGGTFPCCSIYGLDLPIGSAKDMDVATQWRLPTFDSLRKLHRSGRYADHPVCAKCASRMFLNAKLRSLAAAGM